MLLLLCMYGGAVEVDKSSGGVHPAKKLLHNLTQVKGVSIWLKELLPVPEGNNCYGFTELLSTFISFCPVLRL